MRTVLAVCYLTILLVSLSAGQQRVAPGVPPQHYQQPQHQQQHIPQQQQHIPQQQQHIPQQQQHVPQQQVPQHHQGGHQVPTQQQQVQHQGQVPVQQVHQQQQPHGHHHPQPGQILNTANIAAEKQHIQEHMEVPIDTSKMTDQELQFHYFKMHDADNNNKLDGCELIKSLIHWHEQGRKEQGGNTQPAPDYRIFPDEELLVLIDPILRADDGNNDGFIDYPEFIRGQKKTQSQQQEFQQAPPLR